MPNAQFWSSELHYPNMNCNPRTRCTDLIAVVIDGAYRDNDYPEEEAAFEVFFGNKSHWNLSFLPRPND
jgi:hypothetical protein